MKKILTLLLALSLITSLVACGGDKCKDHVDADDDYLCDLCGENFDDGDEDPEAPVETKHSVTFTVKLDDGTPLSGVAFKLMRGESEIASLTSDASGKASVALENLAYSIEYDYDTLPEYCTPDIFGVKIEDGKDAVELVITDNKPDGSLAKPFVVVDDETAITLGAGEKVYYTYRGYSVKYLSVDSADVSVIIGGESYDNTMDAPLMIEPELGVSTLLCLVNNGEAELSFTLSLISPLGSSENPYELTENGATVENLNSETVVFYKWVATASGTLTLTSDSARNNISLTKVMENDVISVEQTNGDLSITMEVKEGDVITIGVSALAGGQGDPVNVDISFTITIS